MLWCVLPISDLLFFGSRVHEKRAISSEDDACPEYEYNMTYCVIERTRKRRALNVSIPPNSCCEIAKHCKHMPCHITTTLMLPPAFLPALNLLRKANLTC